MQDLHWFREMFGTYACPTAKFFLDWYNTIFSNSIAQWQFIDKGLHLFTET